MLLLKIVGEVLLLHFPIIPQLAVEGGRCATGWPRTLDAFPSLEEARVSRW